MRKSEGRGAEEEEQKTGRECWQQTWGVKGRINKGEEGGGIKNRLERHDVGERMRHGKGSFSDKTDNQHTKGQKMVEKPGTLEDLP